MRHEGRHPRVAALCHVIIDKDSTRTRSSTSSSSLLQKWEDSRRLGCSPWHDVYPRHLHAMCPEEGGDLGRVAVARHDVSGMLARESSQLRVDRMGALGGRASASCAAEGTVEV